MLVLNKVAISLTVASLSAIFITETEVTIAINFMCMLSKGCNNGGVIEELLHPNQSVSILHGPGIGKYYSEDI